MRWGCLLLTAYCGKCLEAVKTIKVFYHERLIMTRLRPHIVVFLLGLIGLRIGCSSKSEEGAQSPEYAEKVEIEVKMGSSEGLHDMDEDDLLFTVTNTGEKSITKLLGEVVFFDSGGGEVGRKRWLFIWEDKSIEKVASEDKKAKHRPLPASQTFTTGTDVVFFFAGEPELREKIVSQWDDLTVEIVIREVVIE